jgi:hypothetical protein
MGGIYEVRSCDGLRSHGSRHSKDNGGLTDIQKAWRSDKPTFILAHFPKEGLRDLHAVLLSVCLLVRVPVNPPPPSQLSFECLDQSLWNLVCVSWHPSFQICRQKPDVSHSVPLRPDFQPKLKSNDSKNNFQVILIGNCTWQMFTNTDSLYVSFKHNLFNTTSVTGADHSGRAV